MAGVKELLARNLRTHRNLHGLSQMRFAEKCGVSTAFIAEIEGARKYPSPKTIDRIVDVLGVKPYQLFLDVETSLIETNSAVPLAQMLDMLQDKVNSSIDEIRSQYLSQGH